MLSILTFYHLYLNEFAKYYCHFQINRLKFIAFKHFFKIDYYISEDISSLHRILLCKELFGL